MVEPRVKYTRVQPHDTRVKYFNNRPSVPPRYKRSPQDEEDKNLGKVLIKLDQSNDGNHLRLRRHNF